MCFAINVHGPLDTLHEGLQLPEFESCLVPAVPGQVLLYPLLTKFREDLFVYGLNHREGE